MMDKQSIMELYKCGTPDCPRGQFGEGYCCEPCRLGKNRHLAACDQLHAKRTSKVTRQRAEELLTALCLDRFTKEPPKSPEGRSQSELKDALAEIPKLLEAITGCSPAAREGIAQNLAERERRIRRTLSRMT
jgi:hypothetical protein